MRTLMAVLADRAEEVNGKGSVIGIFQAVTARTVSDDVVGRPGAAVQSSTIR